MDPVVERLLDDADPALRAATLVELRGRAPDDTEILTLRREATRHGAAASLLAGVHLSARDSISLYRPKYGAPFHRLVALADLSMPASDPRVAALLDACLDAFLARPGEKLDAKEQEVCLTGNLARAALAMGRGDDARVAEALAWLVEAELPDGGWHCWGPTGSVDGWEALAAFALVPKARRSAAMRAAIARGVDLFLESRLGLDDGYGPWRRLHFPRHYYYDALVGLEIATALGDPKDPRLAPALDWLASKRGGDGFWRADAEHPDLGGSPEYVLRPGEPVTPLVLEPLGASSTWLTLRALAVLDRAGRA